MWWHSPREPCKVARHSMQDGERFSEIQNGGHGCRWHSYVYSSRVLVRRQPVQDGQRL